MDESALKLVEALMTAWVKVYNSMPSHPKLMHAGALAGWLYVCGLCYANEHLTDGFVPKYALVSVAPGVRKPTGLAARLVEAGLWDEVEGGWRIHDYDRHQRSADEIRDQRSRDAARKRSAKNPGGVRAESSRPPEHKRVEVEVEKNRQRQNTSTATSSASADFLRLSHKLATNIRAVDPNAAVSPDSKRWVDAIRLLHEQDDRSLSLIERIIDWLATEHPDAQFWATVVLSPSKLRKQFTTLVAKSQRANGTTSSHLPEHQRPTEEWKADVAAHLEWQKENPPEWLVAGRERMEAELEAKRRTG